MSRCLTGDTNLLTHLGVARCLDAVLVAAALVGSSSSLLVSLSLCLFLLLLGLPFFSNLLELCGAYVSKL